jgi:hypothetical protein
MLRKGIVREVEEEEPFGVARSSIAVGFDMIGTVQSVRDEFAAQP